MMPRSTATFFLAIMVLAAALMLPAPPRYKASIQALDLAGITEVEVRGEVMVGIGFRSDEPPSLQLDDPEGTVQVTRDGNRLVVTSDSKKYNALQIVLPVTVTTLVVRDARVDAEDDIDALEIHASGVLVWNGDANNLQLLDRLPVTRPEAAGSAGSPRRKERCFPACTGDYEIVFHVESGRIGRLHVDLPRAGLRIQDPDNIGAATLQLGTEAWVSLERAKRLDNIHIQQGVAPAGPRKEPENLE
jgi:hypothetical protein